MDPEATYEEFLDALRGGDPETAAHRAEDLAGWIRTGGFLPEKLLSLGITPCPAVVLLENAATVLGWAKERRYGKTVE